MIYQAELLVLLLSGILALNEAQHVEIASDLRYACQSDSHYEHPIDESYKKDFRVRRQEKPSLSERIAFARNMCAADLGIPDERLPENLLECDNPTTEIKCLMACVLQRMQLMTKRNLLSVRSIERMADEVGHSNPLLTSIAIALADQFNQRLGELRVKDQCEAGYLINEYLSRELKNRKINIH